MQIILTEQQKRILAGHARSCEPNESCAILFGSMTTEAVTVSDIFLTENAKESATEFAVPDGQLLRAYQKAEDAGTAIIGIFHSHPNSEAYPSDTDVKFMECNPVVWLIYSGTRREFRAFVADGRIAEIRMAGPADTLNGLNMHQKKGP